MKYKKIFSFLLILIFSTTLLSAQFDEEAVTGGAESAQDTSKVKQLLENSSMTGGLLDGAIDPKEYIVGPGDEFIINIVSSRSEQVKASILPDGRLLIKNVGVIDLQNKTLEESYKLIETKVKNVYNSKEISVILSNIRKFKVTVSGQTFTQATVAATSTERVNEVINKVGGFDKKSSLRNIRLIRNDSIIKVDLIKFFNIGDKSVNPYVSGGDQIIVPPFNHKSTIEINGEVPKRIEVEYIVGDSLSTIIKMSQGFLSSSDLSSVEISRLENNGISVEKIYLDLTSWRETLYKSSSLPNDMELRPGDRVYVKKKENWTIPSYVKVLGEVKYPGKYTIELGKTRISDIITRAGGFNDNAYQTASVLIRQKEMERTDAELERLKTIDRSEMTKSELKYFAARISEKKGLMAVNFKKAVEDPSSVDNILLQNKDSIIVPETIDFINIQGRVNSPGNVQYNENFDYLDYVALAGGFGYRADIDETFVTKSKGEQFLAEDYNYVLEPGDTILVPPEEEVTFFEIFTTALTIAAQLVTVVGVIITLVRLK
ncbi:MAG: SLBB domain-containing protein [Candidatus Kapaibacterium sp.]